MIKKGKKKEEEKASEYQEDQVWNPPNSLFDCVWVW